MKKSTTDFDIPAKKKGSDLMEEIDEVEEIEPVKRKKDGRGRPRKN